MLDVVANRQITFIRTSRLNDPFDPYLFFETDFDDNFARLNQYVERHHPQDAICFKNEVTQPRWNTISEAMKDHFETVRRTAFVLSTSAATPEQHPKDNLYMWGHYGRGHHGVAIEFDTKALAKAVLVHDIALNGTQFEGGDLWVRMEYARGFSPITGEDVYDFIKKKENQAKTSVAQQEATRIETYISRMSTVKSDAWRSENEWRLMRENSETTDDIYKCPILADCIATIYLGLSLPQEAQDRIVSAAKAGFPAATIMKALKRHGDLALDFRQI